MSLSIKTLKELTPLQVLENEEVKDRFVNLYQNIHRKPDGEAFFEKTKYNFQRIVMADNNLKQCTGFSTYGVFLDLCAYGLDLDNGSQPLLYIMSRNMKDGNNWVKKMYIDISPFGELALRQLAGQILHADRPVVVFEGDMFEAYLQGGRKVVDYKAAIPRRSNKIIGAFFSVTRPDRTVDFFWMLEDDIKRLQSFSHKSNNRGQAGGNEDKSNALYSSNDGQIDTGFLESKVIKHAFKTFPKIALGKFSQLEQAEEQVNPIDYGLDEDVTRQTPPPEPFKPEAGDPGFEEEKPEDEGVTIDLGDEEGGF